MERWRSGLIAAAAVLLLLGNLSCRKAAVPAAAVADPPKSAATNAAGPLPAITTSGTQFDGAAWVQAKLANDKNVSAGAGKSYAHVTYKPEVKIVDESAVLQSLQGVSSDGHGAVFNNAPAEVRALKGGDIFMVKNDFAVKVLGAETDGAQTTILFDNAKLADVVQSGEIHLDTPVSFHGPTAVSATPASSGKRGFDWRNLFETPVYADTNPADQMKDFAKELLSGWTVEQWSVTPVENSASISARMTKDMAGFLAAVSMNGTVSNFQFAQDLKFPVNSDQVISGVKGMSGKMTFTWEIGKGTPGVWATEDRIKLPAGVTISLAPLLEGLPLALDISAALLIHPGLTGGNEYSKGGFTIGWNSTDSDEGLTFAIDEDKNISAVAPDAMVIAFCVPRVELQLSPMSAFAGIKGLSTAAGAVDSLVAKLEQKLLSPDTLAALQKSPMGNFSVTNMLKSNADVYAQIIHTEAATHSATLTPAQCSKVMLKIDGQVGGDANLLGVAKGSESKTMFTKTYTRWTPNSKFCTSS